MPLRVSQFPCAFGRYTLLGRLGKGGMAEVFRATLGDVAGVEKQLAIKRILPHLSDDDQDFVGMFVREASATVALAHNNVVSVYEFGHVEGDYYIAMEYVDGADLRKLLHAAESSRIPIPLELSVYIAAELLTGLEHAHQSALVHRDVSPSNVMFSRTGQIKLGDFGIVKVEGSNHTLAGALKGKVAYMSPEQTRGEPLDGRSDTFSVGVVLYELLTGARPFGGDTQEVQIAAIQTMEPIAPRALNPLCSERVERAVLKGLAKNPGDRYPSAGAFARELRECLVAEGVVVDGSDVSKWVGACLAKPTSPSPQREITPVLPESVASSPPSDPLDGHLNTAVFATASDWSEDALARSADTTRTQTRISPDRRVVVLGAAVILLGLVAWLGVRGIGEPARTTGVATGATPVETVARLEEEAVPARERLPVEVTPVVRMERRVDSRTSPKGNAQLSISVAYRQWANVSIDGGPARPCPVKNLALTPGRHTLRFIGAEGRTRTHVIELREGDNVIKRFDWSHATLK